jgi:hypothetical protein
MNIKAKYQGGGFIQGIPARDLTDDEWKALEKKQQDLAIKSGLYKLNDKQTKEFEKEGE